MTSDVQFRKGASIPPFGGGVAILTSKKETPAHLCK
jgi:hypothetical protein